jgi:hypothetical protein
MNKLCLSSVSLVDPSGVPVYPSSLHEDSVSIYSLWYLQLTDCDILIDQLVSSFKKLPKVNLVCINSGRYE